MQRQNIPWEAISAKLKKDADQEQKKQIQDWLEDSPEHPLILSEILNTWAVTKNKTEFYQPDMTINWQKLMKRINYQLKQKVVLQDKLISDLKPGQQLIYDDGKYYLQKAENLEALTAWPNNMLIFDNQPFEEVIHYLEKWYGVKIQLDHSLYYSHNYTFKVKTESLREVMELISVITPIQYHIEGEQVTIKYKKMR